VFLGYDQPRPMGNGQTGGVLAAPIFTQFMKLALADASPKEFQPPPAIELVPVDRRTGLRAEEGGEGVVLEAFKPGSAPPVGSRLMSNQDVTISPARAWRQQYRQPEIAAPPPRRLPDPPPIPLQALGNPFQLPQIRATERHSEPNMAGQYRMLPNGVILKVR
jgi:hypothetical protein